MFEVFGLGAEFLFNASGTERIVNVVSELQRLDTQIRNTGDGITDFNQRLLEFSGALVNTGASMMAKGLTQTYAAMKGIGQAAEWETAMVNAVRYMDDDSSEAQTAYNKALSETAKLLGKTKEEINESVVAYMMMGKSSDEALRLSQNAGYAAVAWDMTAGQVSDSFRTIKAAFNVNLEDQAMYQKYLDTINEVGNSTAATAADVVEFLSDGGSALHNVANVSMEEAMGMASAARYANMSIAEFSTMMTRLGNQYATDKSTKYFSALGVEVKDANGEMRSFAEVLYDVQKQWNDLDVATKSTFAAGVGGVYADRLSLYMGSADEYKKGSTIAGQDNTGSAEAEFSRVTNTFEMAMARLKVTTDDFVTAFWGTLLPPLTKFINVVTTVIDKISRFMQAHPAIMKVAAGFILLSGVAIALGGSFLLISGIMTKFIATIRLGYGPLKLLSSGMQGLKLALSSIAGPAKLAMGSMLKLTISMGVLYAAWKYDLFGLRSSLTEFQEKMQYSLNQTRELLSDSMPVDQFQKQIVKLSQSESIWDKLTLIMTKFGMVWKGVTEAWNTYELSDSMYQKLQAAGVLETVTWILLMKMKLTAFFEGVKEGFMTVVNVINGFIQNVLRPPFEWLMNNVLLPLADKILGAGNALEVFFGKSNDAFGDATLQKWKMFGEIAGGILATLMAFKSVTAIGNIVGSVRTLGGLLGGGSGGGGGGGNGGGGNGGGGGGGGPDGGGGGNGGGKKSAIPNPKTILVGLADIALIVGGFTLLVAAYGALSNIAGFDAFMQKGLNTLKLLFSGVLGIAVGIGALSVLTALVSKVSPAQFVSGLAGIAIVLGGFTVLIAAYGALAQIPGIQDFMLSGSATLGTLFDAVSVFACAEFLGMVAAMAVIGALSPATFVSGLAGLAVILGGFTLIISAYAALTMIPGFTDFLASGAATLAQLFNSIGEVVGSLIGGFAEGLTASLPEIGNNLSAFGQSVVPFFEAMSSAPLDGVGPFLSALGQFMLMMGGEAVLSFLTGGTDLEQLGSDLTGFGTSAKGFFDVVSTYPEEGFNKAKRVFQSISSLGGYATKSGGLAQVFTGSTDLPKLGTDLSSFATNSQSFFTTVATFPEAGMSKAKLVFESITSLGGYATKSGGLAQLFTGSTDLPKLGTDLTNFATNAQSFFTTVSGFPATGFTKSKQVFEVLDGIGDYDFKSGGLAQIFTGSTDLKGIGTQLTSFGEAVQGYFQIADGLSVSSLNKGKQIFEVLSLIGDDAFKSGGVAQFFNGSVELVSIGTQLSSFGTSVEGFFTVADRITASSTVRAKQIFTALGQMGEFANISVLLTNLGSTGTQLTNFITNAEGFFTKAESINVEGVNTLIPVLQDFFAVFNNLDTSRITSAATAMNNIGDAAENLANKVQSLSADIVTEFGNNVDLVKNFCDDANNTVAGTNLPQNVAEGITSNGSLVKDSVTTVFQNAATVLPGGTEGPFSYSSLYSSGQKVMSTMASGITSSSGLIKSAMLSAFNNAKAVLPHSDADEGPFSKLTSSGMAIPNTIASGIDKTSNSIYDSLYAAGTNAMGALPSDIGMSVNPEISDDYKQTNYERVAQAQTAVAEQKANTECTLTIAPGAIVISPQIQGGSEEDANRMADLIREMMESEIFPYIMSEFERLKELKNAR